MGKKNGPEQWHARVLADEVVALTAAVRTLEYRAGWHDAADGWALEDGGVEDLAGRNSAAVLGEARLVVPESLRPRLVFQ